MNSFPFDSQVTHDNDGNSVYDRSYNSDDLASKFALLFKNGVFPNPSTGLQVTTNSENMSVTVLPGNCNINGRLAVEKENRTIVFEAAGTVHDRIDRVVVRLNTNVEFRNVDIYVVKGSEAATPVPAVLTRTGGIYEICLANVFIAKNTTVITGSRITDTRLDADVCGIVTSQTNEVDTSTIFNQYQAALDEYLSLVGSCISGTVEGELRNLINANTSNLNTVTGEVNRLNAVTGKYWEMYTCEDGQSPYSGLAVITGITHVGDVVHAPAGCKLFKSKTDYTYTQITQDMYFLVVKPYQLSADESTILYDGGQLQNEYNPVASNIMRAVASANQSLLNLLFNTKDIYAYTSMYEAVINNPCGCYQYKGYNWPDCPLESGWGTIITIGIAKTTGILVFAIKNNANKIYWNILSTAGTWTNTSASWNQIS